MLWRNGENFNILSYKLLYELWTVFAFFVCAVVAALIALWDAQCFYFCLPNPFHILPASQLALVSGHISCLGFLFPFILYTVFKTQHCITDLKLQWVTPYKNILCSSVQTSWVLTYLRLWQQLVLNVYVHTQLFSWQCYCHNATAAEIMLGIVLWCQFVEGSSPSSRLHGLQIPCSIAPYG
jgi:hypothetical protein